MKRHFMLVEIYQETLKYLDVCCFNSPTKITVVAIVPMLIKTFPKCSSGTDPWVHLKTPSLTINEISYIICL